MPARAGKKKQSAVRQVKRRRAPMNRKKKEFAVALALLSASSALCLRIMKKVDEKLRREKEKRTRK